MRRLALLLLLSLTASAQWRQDHRDRRDRRDDRGSSNKRLLSLLPGGTTGYNAGTGAIYTTSGVPVTFTRASTRTCTEPTTGAIASLGTNVPCVTSQGLVMEPAATNVVLFSEDFTNAAWLKVSDTVSASGFTTPAGTTAQQHVLGSSSYVRSAVGVTPSATQYTVSVYARVPSGSVSIFSLSIRDVNGSNASAWAATSSYGVGAYVVGNQHVFRVTTAGTSGSTQPTWCLTNACTVTDGTVTWTEAGLNIPAYCGNLTLTTTWQRFSCTTSVAVETTNSLMAFYDLASQSGTILLYGAQIETGSVATSYILTTGTAATRAAETPITLPMPSALSRTEGCARFCITPEWTGARPTGIGSGAGEILVADGAGNTRFGYMNATDNLVRAYDGTHIVASPTANFTAGVPACFRTRWSAAGNFLVVDNVTTGTTGTPSAFSGFGAYAANLSLNNNPGFAGEQLAGTVSSIVLGNSATACQ